MKLANRSQVPPPPHFRYKHPVSGAEFIKHNWDLLRGEVTAHTEGNGYPPVSDDEIDQQMCENMGQDLKERFCMGEGLTVRGGLHWRELIGGTQVFAQHLLNGRKRVSQERAEQRATICVACPRNSFYSKPCGGDCPEIDNLVVGIVGDGKTSLDAKLEACSVCGCVLRAAVWVPAEQLSTVLDADFIKNAPETCWKREELMALREKARDGI